MFGTQYSVALADTVRDDAKTTILVVDDEPEVRSVVAEFLEDFGYRVLQAEGGNEALLRLDNDLDVQLLITDIRMPNMSGIELADRAEQQHPELKVILISGFFVAQPLRHRLLHKPFHVNELQQAVQKELDATH